MRGGNGHGQKVPFLKSPAYIIIHVSFSALWQQGGASSGDITTTGDTVLIIIPNPLVRCWIQWTGLLTSGGFSFWWRKQTLWEHRWCWRNQTPCSPWKTDWWEISDQHQIHFQPRQLSDPSKMKDQGVSDSVPPCVTSGWCLSSQALDSVLCLMGPCLLKEITSSIMQ